MPRMSKKRKHELSFYLNFHVYGQEKALRSFDSGVFYSDIKECHECVISGIVAREYKI